MEITTKPGDLHSENQRKSSPKLKPGDFTSQPYENVEFNTKTRKQLGTRSPQILLDLTYDQFGMHHRNMFKRDDDQNM